MRRLRRPLFAALAVLLPLSMAAGTAALADDPLPFERLPFHPEDTEFFECINPVPHISVDLQARRTVDVAVVVDTVATEDRTAPTLERVAAIMERVRQIYSPPPGASDPGVDINIVDVHSHEFHSDETRGFVTPATPLEDTLMDELVRHYREQHPDLARHHVHLITGKDIKSSTDDTSLLGISNCVGSVGQPELSFTISEVGGFEPDDLRGIVFYSELDEKIVAHELGHAFGAHHHYANCVEPAARAVRARKADPCSLMFNDGNVVSTWFSAPEALAIRSAVQHHVD